MNYENFFLSIKFFKSAKKEVCPTWWEESCAFSLKRDLQICKGGVKRNYRERCGWSYRSSGKWQKMNSPLLAPFAQKSSHRDDIHWSLATERWPVFIWEKCSSIPGQLKRGKSEHSAATIQNERNVPGTIENKIQLQGSWISISKAQSFWRNDSWLWMRIGYVTPKNTW